MINAFVVCQHIFLNHESEFEFEIVRNTNTFRKYVALLAIPQRNAQFKSKKKAKKNQSKS